MYLVHLEPKPRRIPRPRNLLLLLTIVRGNPPSLTARSWLVTGPIKLAMARKLAGRIKVSPSSRQGLNLELSTLIGGGFVVGLIVGRQIGQMTTSAGTVAATMAQGVITMTALCPMMNLNTSGMKATAHTGAEEVVEGETGSLGDLVLTMLPEDAVMPTGEADEKGSKQLSKILSSRNFRPESG